MKSFVLILAVFALSATMFGAVQTWNHAALIDSECAAKMKANPDAHTRQCALMCAKSGLGIVTADGTFLKFDAKGTDQAIAALKASKQDDHLRATVTGEREGDTIKVQSFKLE
ncbi:MAG: hypothetical protein ABSG25_14375 [Bryobacteraceae bacterium]